MRRPTTLLLAGVLLAGCTAATAGTQASPTASASASATSAAADTSAAPTTTGAASLTEIGAGLQGPAGLAATVYDTGLSHVSAFAFDASERLWAATAAYTDDGSDGVYLVAAAGAAPVKVIAGQHTPLGLVWIGDMLYVASAGRVDGYSGYKHGAFARHSTVLTLPSGVGETNGLALAPDGRFVLGVSAPCDACTPTSPYAGAVLSFLPDGSDLRIEASGIRAPVGLAYYPRTNDLFATLNQRDDLGDATPGDWLAVIRSGQAWGFPDCYGQGGTACDGVPQPVAALDTHAAVSGVAIVTGQLGSTVGTSAVVAEWATGKVLRVALTAQGGTYRGIVEPFLTGLTNPVPVAIAPDGALLVGDWGTGTIYRVARA
jgi:glucose/arabinose dehydrogenase